MSNARSPREVCSTTIGTSGLTVLASFRFRRSSPACFPGWRARRQTSNRRAPLRPVVRLGRRGPELPGSAALGLARRPQLVARPRLLDRDRLRGFGDDVERLALREVVLERVEPAGGAQALEQLLRRRPLAGGALDGLEQLLLGRLDALGLHDRGQHRLAPQGTLGVRLALLDDLVLL